MDVMELGQVDPRTVVSLALTRIAQGEVDSALSLVEANRAILPVSDYGLTLALAGRSADAVSILTDAIRSGRRYTADSPKSGAGLRARWSLARCTRHGLAGYGADSSE